MRLHEAVELEASVEVFAVDLEVFAVDRAASAVDLLAYAIDLEASDGDSTVDLDAARRRSCNFRARSEF